MEKVKGLFKIGTGYYNNGNKYEGEWHNMKIHGQGKVNYKLGTYWFANGDIYIGEFYDGKLEGKGKK